MLPIRQRTAIVMNEEGKTFIVDFFFFSKLEFALKPKSTNLTLN